MRKRTLRAYNNLPAFQGFAPNGEPAGLTLPASVSVCLVLQSLRAISTARLSVSPHVHLRPIDVVVCDGP